MRPQRRPCCTDCPPAPRRPLQARFTEAILRQMAGIQFPPDRIFSQTVSGAPKSEVLEMLAGRHPHAPARHFVEDKMSTLEKVWACVCVCV